VTLGNWFEQKQFHVVDAAGRLTLSQSGIRDQNEVLWVRAHGFLPVYLPLPAGVIGLVKVTLVRAGQVSGRVVDQLGRPVPGATIRASLMEQTLVSPVRAEIDDRPCETQCDASTIETITGAGGEFDLNELQSGSRVQLSLSATNHVLLEDSIVEVSRRDLELRAQAMAPVLFRFPDLPAQGYLRGEICCERVAIGEGETFPEAERFARFSLAGVTQDLSDTMPAGRYAVSWSLDGLRGPGVQTFDIGPGLTVIEIR
jgi:hypothetical protein